MDAIREYLLRIAAAALICSILTAITGKKGTLGTVVKLVSGLLLTLTVVSPWTAVRFDGILDFAGDISADADAAAASGENAALEAYSAIIKEETEAYILDKADSLGAELTVNVLLEGDSPPVPVSVELGGSISPYGKQVLSNLIEEELGIGQEDQIWTGQP